MRLNDIDPAAFEQIVKLDYTNHMGKRYFRRVVPLGVMSFESNEFHNKPQWLMKVFDLDKMAIRWYAVKYIHAWNAMENE